MSEPLHKQCFLALSMCLITVASAFKVHIVYVAMEEITEFTSCSLPA
uniref:Uncharacterized protein n=1 Tax=Arundo donax TaxID=35708 RepID=A0A0A9HL13_ARUDO